MKQLKLSRLFSLLLALTLALTPCLAGLAEEGNESQNSMDIVLMSGTEDGAGEGTGEGGSGADGGDQPTNVPVTGVTVTPNAITMWVGESAGFNVTVLPENATNKNFSSESSAVTTATVSGSTIQATSPGKATVTVKTADGGEQALLVTTEMPQVRGVAVVCEGGDDEIINEKITNAVTAALNITSKRVYIAGGSFNEKR